MYSKNLALMVVVSVVCWLNAVLLGFQSIGRLCSRKKVYRSLRAKMFSKTCLWTWNVLRVKGKNNLTYWGRPFSWRKEKITPAKKNPR